MKLKPRVLKLTQTGVGAFVAFAMLATPQALPDMRALAQSSESASGASAPVEPPEVSEPLREEQVGRFVDSLSALESWAEPGTLELLALGLAVQPGSLASPLTNAFRLLQGQPDGQEIGRIAERHGFRDGAEWAATGDRVTRAAVAMALERRDTTVERELRWAEEQLSEDTSLPPAQKMMLQGMLRNQAEPVKTALAQVPAEDTAAVEPHYARLEELIESRARTY